MQAQAQSRIRVIKRIDKEIKLDNLISYYKT